MNDRLGIFVLSQVTEFLWRESRNDLLERSGEYKDFVAAAETCESLSDQMEDDEVRVTHNKWRELKGDW